MGRMQIWFKCWPYEQSVHRIMCQGVWGGNSQDSVAVCWELKWLLSKVLENTRRRKPIRGVLASGLL